MSRDYLIEVVSNRHGEVDARTVDALVARLRRKLLGASEPGVIATVSGIGYKLGIAAERNAEDIFERSGCRFAWKKMR